MTPSRTYKRLEDVVILRYAVVMMAAAVLAVVTAVGISAVDPPPAEAALVTVETCTGGSIELKSIEKRTLELHNQTRAAKGLPLFCVHPLLTRAARAHSKDMLERDYFSHDTRDDTETSSDEHKTFGERVRSFGYDQEGYRYYTIGENIAWGSGPLGSPTNIFKAWMNSPGHEANILNENFREIGIGARKGTFCPKSNECYSDAIMYTVDFGTRR